MYALFIDVSLLSEAIIFPSIHKSFYQGSITTTYRLIYSFFNASENGFFSGYVRQISSFNTASSVTTDSFTWKRMLRTVFMTDYQNWQMHNIFFSPPRAASGHSNELLIERVKNGT